jgi:hypothetical protein
VPNAQEGSSIACAASWSAMLSKVVMRFPIPVPTASPRLCGTVVLNRFNGTS